MKGMIKINSDFVDYYDYLSSNESIVNFNRFNNDRLTIYKGLSVLRSIGIKTVETKAVRELQSDYVIIHNKDDSVIMKYTDACMIYPNSLASECNIQDNLIYKLLQIGARRFRLILKLRGYSLNEYDIVSIDEVGKSYNVDLSMPIYSIDYINTDKGMIAIRLNNIENLSKYGFDKLIKPEEVVDNILDSVIKYNKL